MQNKPNFRKHKMDLTHYEQKDYEHEPPLRTPKKQTQSNPISNPYQKRIALIDQPCYHVYKDLEYSLSKTMFRKGKVWS